MFKLILITTSVLLMLVGCGTRNVRSDYSISKTSQTGVIFGSITRSGPAKADSNWYTPNVVNISLHYRNLRTGEKGRIDLDSLRGGSLFRGDFSGVVGKLFVVELPSGEYEINGWVMERGTSAFLTPQQPFSIKFNVEPATLKYVGNFDFFQIAAKNGFGLPLIFGADVTVNDSRLRDFEVATKQYPNLGFSAAQVDILKYQPQGSVEIKVTTEPLPSSFYSPAYIKH